MGRPFTGAWIETVDIESVQDEVEGRPFTGAWIETLPFVMVGMLIMGRPFTGAWIETSERRNNAQTK